MRDTGAKPTKSGYVAEAGAQCEVLEDIVRISVQKGWGVEEDPVRIVVSYWRGGRCLAVFDPAKGDIDPCG